VEGVQGETSQARGEHRITVVYAPDGISKLVRLDGFRT
jgi:hypothetical protein